MLKQNEKDCVTPIFNLGRPIKINIRNLRDYLPSGTNETFDQTLLSFSQRHTNTTSSENHIH